MNDKPLCQATTKAGNPCKNKAIERAAFCRVHQTAARNAEFEALVTELNELAAEVRTLEAQFDPPPFSTKGMIKLLKENMEKFTPDMRLAIVGELKDSFEGASPSDLLDADTWKGMWYVLNYSVQNQTEGLREGLAARLAKLPGGELVVDVANTLEGASPKDFLEVDTWKGLWYMVNYSLRFEAEKVKSKILGVAEGEDG